MNFAKFRRTSFVLKTTRRLFLIIALSIVVRGEFANETVSYDIEFKTYQFDSEQQVVKKGSLDERTSLTHVFEEGIKNKCGATVNGTYQNQLEKSTTSVKSLPHVGNS